VPLPTKQLTGKVADLDGLNRSRGKVGISQGALDRSAKQLICACALLAPVLGKVGLSATKNIDRVHC
jgi:hypothetical protein